MPRVPDSHLEARRDQILTAARRCFSRNGFHATSMQDVIEEAGLSVGAVYRYFKSKDEIRTAVAEETVGAMLDEFGAIATHEPPLALVDAMTRVVGVIESRLAGEDPVARIVVQAWAEALRDPDLGRFARHVVGSIQGHFAAIARQAQRAGDLPTTADPRAAGTALMALVPGYIVQRLLTGTPDADTFLAGIRTLLRAPGV